MTKKSQYSEQDIDVLKGLEPVQMRPGMYTRTDSPNHIIQEVIDNAQDEALAGFASLIAVELHEDGSISVEDNGRGIPTGKHPTEGKPVIEVVFTFLHAGGKFRKGEGQTYGFTGGLHGVGVSVTNALSDRLEVTVFRDGYQHNITFANGAVVEPLSRKKLPEGERDKTGTRVRSWPNPKYFEHAGLQVQEMERYLRSKAVLLKGTQMSWTRPDRPPMVWSFPEGMPQYLEEQMQGEGEWVAPIFTANLHHAEATNGYDKGEGFELAVGFLADGRSVRESYVNLIPTADGGRHETGLKAGLLDAVRAVAERTGAIPKGIKIDGEDVWSSIAFVLSVKLMDPQFQNQTKDRMTSEKGHRLVSGLLRDPMELWLNDHPQHAKAIIELIVSSAIRRSKAGIKTDRKRAVGASMLPGKLADCQTKDVNDAELFLVEGDSAGGCFLPSTAIKLQDGCEVTIQQLVSEQDRGKTHQGFTVSEDGVVVKAGLLHARLTKHAVEVIKIIISGGYEEVSTPDHLFMLSDRSYRRADLLKPGDELMSLDSQRSVVSSELMSGRHDVYDIEVPGTHNFALASGIFVHNSSKVGRDRIKQAILPLRGKLLNTWDVDSHKALASETISDIAAAIGVDPHTGRKAADVDLSRLRYGKIFIMADADVDGQHIQVLLLTLFLRHFPALIEKGHIWIAQAPLYRVDAPAKKGTKTGPRKLYALDERELEAFQKMLDKEGVKNEVTRFKGLGEMNAKQLGETTMHPDSRRSLRITIKDAEAARVAFERMMGKNSKPRKDWMEEEGATVDVD